MILVQALCWMALAVLALGPIVFHETDRRTPEDLDRGEKHWLLHHWSIGRVRAWWLDLQRDARALRHR